MSAHRLQPPDNATRDEAPRPGRGRARRAGLVRVVLVLTVATALALVLAIPDRDGVTRTVPTSRASVPAPGAVAGSVTGSVHRRRATRPVAPPAHAELTISATAPTMRVPRSFFGISTEYFALPLYERHTFLFERILSLLHTPGDGPLVLRIGGDSADLTFWNVRLRRVPPWVFTLTPSWLRQTSTVVRQTGARLIIDLNLVTGSPPVAAAWAWAAEKGLPRRSIIGFEIGNEPDIYSRSYWEAITSRTMMGTDALPPALSATGYSHDFQSYSNAVAKAAPHVPLLGPAIANPGRHVAWIASLLAGSHPGLRIVTAHKYPYSECATPKSAGFATIARLLSQNASAGMAQTVTGAALLAHRAGLPFRLTELNSVTCHGRPGVSNTFATALWAPDALFELLRAGVDAVNMHIRPNAINAPFTLRNNGIKARPLFYGQILFTRTLGPDPRLVGLQLHGASSLNVKAWAVRVRGNTLHVLVINKSPRAVDLAMYLPAHGPATVSRLLAPSVSATSGVTLAGQHLGRDGRWLGRHRVQRIIPRAHGYELMTPRMSAALLSVHLRAGALAGSAQPG